jgi:recombination protein RecT
MNALAMQVVPLSSVGLDPLQPNHVNLIPYKNGHTNKYDITPIIGYRGLGLKALKYALEELKDVIIELVYSNDEFRLIKKDVNNERDTYVFNVKNPFDRGELLGGFYCQRYQDGKADRIRVFTKVDIEKRKPKYASAEFWGGTNYKGEKIDGWYEEMAYKTIYRAAYNDVIIDSSKIDAQFAKLSQIQDEFNAEPTPTEDITHEVVNETASQTITFELEQAPEPTPKKQKVAITPEITDFPE